MSNAKRKFKAETLKAWKQQYASATTASHTRSMCPELEDALKVAEAVPVSFFWTQFLTGHSYCRSYLHPFKISDTNTCPCDDSTEQTMKHILTQCTKFIKERLDYELMCSALRVPAHNILEALKKETTKEAYPRYIISMLSRVKAFNQTTNVDT